MKSTKKFILAAMSVVLAMGLSTTGCTKSQSSDVAQSTADASLFDNTVTDIQGNAVSQELIDSIADANADLPLADSIIAYGSDGLPIALDQVEADYEGFVITLDATSKDVAAKAAAAIDAGIVQALGGNALKASSLESLADFFTDDDLSAIEPNYIRTINATDEVQFELSPVELADNKTSNDTTANNVLDADNATADVNLIANALQTFARGDDASISHQGDLDLIKVDSAWNRGVYGQKFTNQGDDIVIAIVDSGIMGTGEGTLKHEDLDYSRILPGYNYIKNSSVPGTSDVVGHGTFVAGQILATHNDIGVAGVAPQVKIRPYKVIDDKNIGTVDDFVAAIYQCIKDGDVDVINISMGGEGFMKAECDAVTAAMDAGIIVVAAVGNDSKNTDHFPAAYPNVIGVSATDLNGGHAAYSVYGTNNVDVAAPGTAYGVANSTTTANGYRSSTGTSMACPLVSSLAGLAKSISGTLDQESYQQLLVNTSIDKGAAGFDEYYGYGLISYENVFNYLLGEEHNVAHGVSGTVNWYITDDDGTYPNELVLEPSSGATGVLALTSFGGSSSSPTPWDGHSSTVQSVYIQPGVSAGYNMARAFADMTNAKKIDLTNLDVSQVTSWDDAFIGLDSLEEIRFGSSFHEKPLTFTLPGDSESQCISWYANGENIPIAAGTTVTINGAITYQKKAHHSPTELPGTPATCSSPGKTGATVCEVCGEEIAAPETIPAIPHDYVERDEYTDCIKGTYKEYVCSACNNLKIEMIKPGTGHAWSEPIWVWSDDLSSANVRFVCANDATHEKSQAATVRSGVANGIKTSVAFLRHENNLYTETKTMATDEADYPLEFVWTAEVAGTGGTISPSEIKVEQGGTAEFEFIPDEGYEVYMISVDDAPYEAYSENVYTVDNVELDGQIVVMFKESDGNNSDDPANNSNTGNANNGSNTNDNNTNIDGNTNVGNTNVGNTNTDDNTNTNGNTNGNTNTEGNTNTGNNTNTDGNTNTNDNTNNANNSNNGGGTQITGKPQAIIPTINNRDSLTPEQLALMSRFGAALADAPEGEKAVYVEHLKEGSSYDAMMFSIDWAVKNNGATPGEVAGVFNVDLAIDGVNRSSNFGRLTLNFPVETKHEGKIATVYHLHYDENGKSTIRSYEELPIKNGLVEITIDELSTFAVNINQDTGNNSQNGNINGNTNSNGNTSVTPNTNADSANKGLSANMSKTGDNVLGLAITLSVIVLVAAIILGIALKRRMR